MSLRRRFAGATRPDRWRSPRSWKGRDRIRSRTRTSSRKSRRYRSSASSARRAARHYGSDPRQSLGTGQRERFGHSLDRFARILPAAVSDEKRGVCRHEPHRTFSNRKFRTARLGHSRVPVRDAVPNARLGRHNGRLSHDFVARRDPHSGRGRLVPISQPDWRALPASSRIRRSATDPVLRRALGILELTMSLSFHNLAACQ